MVAKEADRKTVTHIGVVRGGFANSGRIINKSHQTLLVEFLVVSKDLSKGSILPISTIGGYFAALRMVGLVLFGRLCRRMTPTLVLERYFGALSLTGSGGTVPVPGDFSKSG